MAAISVQEGGGGDYTTLAAAIAAANASDVITISGTWSAIETLSITVPDNNLTIEATGSAKWPGYFPGSPTHYRCKSTGGHVFTVTGDGITFDGLDVNQDGTGGSDEGFRVSGDGVTITDSVIWASGNTSDQDGIYSGNTDSSFILTNCLIFGFARAGVHPQNFSGTVTQEHEVLSCTITACGNDDGAESGGIGIRAATGTTDITLNIGNCIILGNNSTNDFAVDDHPESVTSNIDRCIYGSLDTGIDSPTDSLASRTLTDSTSPGAGDWVMVSNITGARSTWDLRLQDNAENDAQDMHADGTVAGATLPTPDALGTTRPQNTNYDCGFYEIAAAGGATVDPAACTAAITSDVGSVAQVTFQVDPADTSAAIKSDAGTINQVTFQVGPADAVAAMSADAGVVTQAGVTVSPVDAQAAITSDAGAVSQVTFQVAPAGAAALVVTDAGSVSQVTFVVTPSGMVAQITADFGVVSIPGVGAGDMYTGLSAIVDLYIGSVPVTKVYNGTSLIWERSSEGVLQFDGDTVTLDSEEINL